MKTKLLFMASMVMLGTTALKAQLNVGSTTAPDESAILQATSTTKGFLTLSMTAAQIAAIVNPAKGSTVFNNETNQLQVNIGTTAVTVWVAAAGTNTAWGAKGNTGTVTGTNYLGTTGNAALG